MKIISLFKYLTNNIPSSFCCFKTLEIIRLHDKINSRPQNYSILFYTSYKISEILKDTFLRILHTRAHNLQHEKDLFSPNQKTIKPNFSGLGCLRSCRHGSKISNIKRHQPEHDGARFICRRARSLARLSNVPLKQSRHPPYPLCFN